MELRVIASGSKANGYALTNGREALLIEAGCKYKDMLQVLDYNTEQICALLISHEHCDHYRYADQYRDRGFQVVEPFREEMEYGVACKPGESGKAIFSYQPFQVPHQEDLQCYGYLIKHRDLGKLLFMTDLEYCPYNMETVKPDTVMVECNYMYIGSELVLEQKLRTDHKYSGHMSLKTCKEFLGTVKSDNLKHVVLLHMSYETCDPDEAVRQVSEVVGENVTVDIAEKGLVLDLTRQSDEQVLFNWKLNR